MIDWNQNVKLIISDVDETIADLYVKAEDEMIFELEKLLVEGKVLFLISGQGADGIKSRITDYIRVDLRKNVLIGHCSGTEVLGFDEEGEVNEEPYYSLYDELLSDGQKLEWREVVNQLVDEFELKVCPTTSIDEFKEKAGDNPFAVMLEDRGPQITFEIINGYDLSEEQVKEIEIEVPSSHGFYDLRIPLLERAKELFDERDLPITPRLAGVFAIDLVLNGVSKTTAVKYVLENKSILKDMNLDEDIIDCPEKIEVWGDKFSILRGGTDRHISEALPRGVRSISFREENREEFLEGYNIVVWDGNEYLHHGLLEYLKLRDKNV